MQQWYIEVQGQQVNLAGDSQGGGNSGGEPEGAHNVHGVILEVVGELELGEEGRT